ncbi:MAG TPA: peptidase C13 [Rhodanobacter sp.]|nr:peptidase C13 [Rhodanobacter sp.]
MKTRTRRRLPIRLAIVLLLAAPPALAGSDFAGRVQQAKLAEAAATGPGYQKALWAQIGTATGHAYQACLKASTPQDKTPFTLVLALDTHGKPHDVAAQPAIPVAECMVKTFAGWTFPVPPAKPAPYPLEIDFSVTGE